jgi:hypothetical protein
MVSQVRSAHFLLQHRHHIEHQRDHSSALNDLNETHVTEIIQQSGKDQGASNHANEQHEIEQRDDSWPGLLGSEIGRQCQTGGLCNVHAQAR